MSPGGLVRAGEHLARKRWCGGKGQTSGLDDPGSVSVSIYPSGCSSCAPQRSKCAEELGQPREPSHRSPSMAFPTPDMDRAGPTTNVPQCHQ